MAGLALGKAEFVEALKIQPKFCTRAKEMSEAQDRIAGNGPLTIQNRGDAVGWTESLRASSAALLASSLSGLCERRSVVQNGCRARRQGPLVRWPIRDGRASGARGVRS